MDRLTVMALLLLSSLTLGRGVDFMFANDFGADWESVGMQLEAEQHAKQGYRSRLMNAVSSPSPPDSGPPPSPNNGGQPAASSPPEPSPTYAPSYPPPPYYASPPPYYSQPPPYGGLPPVEVSIINLDATGEAEIPSSSGFGLVRIRPIGAYGSPIWSYMCGDAWAGWDANAANAFCRQANFNAGGEAVRFWRPSDFPPSFLGKITCTGTETSLHNCDVASVPGKIDSWSFAVNISDAGYAGACAMLAAVRCRIPRPIRLRPATSPSPINSVVGAQHVRFMRLEAAIGPGSYGAVCRDRGFDNAAATVACKMLNYTSGGFSYTAGASTGTPNMGIVTLNGLTDALGNYLGTVSDVRCTGTESDLGRCASWTATGDMPVPCQAAAWVGCYTSAAV